MSIFKISIFSLYSYKSLMNSNITVNQPASPASPTCPSPICKQFDRSIEVLKNAPKLVIYRTFSYICIRKPTHFDFRARTIFQRRASHSLSLCQPRLFNADSIDVNASIDRRALKGSKISTLPYEDLTLAHRATPLAPHCILLPPRQLFSQSTFLAYPFSFSSVLSVSLFPSSPPSRFSRDKFRRALDTREKLIYP